jgi:hypothetical protein
MRISDHAGHVEAVRLRRRRRASICLPMTGTRSGDPKRKERLKAALRDNLKRRKAQARGRRAPAGGHQAAVPKKPDS